MKKTVFIAVILVCTSALYAQEKDSTNKFVFPRHEIKISLGDAFHTNEMWESNEMWKTHCKANLSISYSYRCLKWLWFGINVVNYIGTQNVYNIREYNVENNYVDYQYKTKDYGFGLIPEVRFSYLNREKITLYSGIAFGYSFMIQNTDGEPSKRGGLPSYQVSIFAFSCYFGKKQKIFMGGELGAGNRGIFNIHGGYRF